MSADDWREATRDSLPPAKSPSDPLSSLEQFAFAPGMLASIKLQTTTIDGISRILEVGMVWGPGSMGRLYGEDLAKPICATHYILKEHHNPATLAELHDPNFQHTKSELISDKSLEATLSTDLQEATLPAGRILMLVSSGDMRRLNKIGVDVAQLLPGLQVCDLPAAFNFAKAWYGEEELSEAVVTKVGSNDSVLLSRGRYVMDFAFNGREFGLAMVEVLRQRERERQLH